MPSLAEVGKQVAAHDFSWQAGVGHAWKKDRQGHFFLPGACESVNQGVCTGYSCDRCSHTELNMASSWLGEATRLSSLRWMRSCGPQLFHILALNTVLPVLAGLLEDLGGDDTRGEEFSSPRSTQRSLTQVFVELRLLVWKRG